MGKGADSYCKRWQTTSFVPTINTRIGLEFFYDGATEVVDSINIIKVFANRFFDDPNPIKAILTYYESVVLKKQSFDKYTGTIQTFSLGSKYLYSYTFNDGKILAKGLTARVPEKEKSKSIVTIR